MTNTQPRVVAFLSGKGGAGKTTIVISMAKLLADMGERCLLVDLDLATNGASYFFTSKFTDSDIGIWEYLEAQADHVVKSLTGLRRVGRPSPPVGTISRLPKRIAKNFSFVPARVRLGETGKTYDQVNYDEGLLKDLVVRPLLEWAKEARFAYVLIDCQAGFATSSQVVSEFATYAIIVAEPDPISNDAADNVRSQLANHLPVQRRYLVNKIDVRDIEVYRRAQKMFQGISRLPPLPLDFAARRAFGDRKIPVDLEEPSPLLFGLLETMAAVFPHLDTTISEYKAKNTDKLLQEIYRTAEALVEERDKVENDILFARLHLDNPKSNFNKLLLGVTIGVEMLCAGGARYAAGHHRDLILAFAEAIPLLAFTLYYMRKSSATANFDRDRRDAEHRLDIIDRKLNDVRSLLLTRSVEYLVDYDKMKTFQWSRGDRESSTANPA